MGRRLNIVPIPALGDSSLGRARGFHGLISNRGRARRLAPRELLPPVLAVTIYNGRKVWTALDDVFDLIEPVQGWLSRRQPRLRHLALDLRALARQPLPESNVVSWIAASSAENVSRVAREVLEAYPGPEHATLREAFREWVLGAAESWGIEAEVLEQVKSLKEAEMIYAGVEELGEGRGEGRAEGHRRGRITLVCRQARLKFGAETAEHLSRLLEGITDPDRICRIGDRIIECETGAELRMLAAPRSEPARLDSRRPNPARASAVRMLAAPRSDPSGPGDSVACEP